MYDAVESPLSPLALHVDDGGFSNRNASIFLASVPVWAPLDLNVSRPHLTRAPRTLLDHARLGAPWDQKEAAAVAPLSFSPKAPGEKKTGKDEDLLSSSKEASAPNAHCSHRVPLQLLIFFESALLSETARLPSHCLLRLSGLLRFAC